MSALEKWQENVRTAPLQSIGIGVMAAWLLTRLPIAGLLSLVLKIALRLLRPALLILGLAHVCQLIQSRREDTSQALPENHF